MAAEEDERLARLLGAKAVPEEFAATVLKMRIILKRRIEAKRVAAQPRYARGGSAVAEARRPSAARHAAALASPKEHDMQAGLTLLSQRLAFCGLVEAQISGDGNCQFRSISYQLFGTQAHHAHVRARACAHMRANREEYEIFFEPGEFDEWLESMSELKKWGDELTLRAAADAFRCMIHVIQSTPENWHLTYVPAGGEPVRRLVVTYVAPIHYNSVTREFASDERPGGHGRAARASAEVHQTCGAAQPHAREHVGARDGGASLFVRAMKHVAVGG